MQQKVAATHYDARIAKLRLPEPHWLFGDLQSVVHLDAEVPHSRFKFGMPKQQLHRTQVLCTAID